MTRRSLELTQTLRNGNREGSLLSVLDRTRHADGRPPAPRLAPAPAHRPSRPSKRRLDAVAELLDEHALRGDLRELLGEMFDLQRLTARVSTGRATPRDLGAVARTLRLLPRFKARLTARSAPLLAELEGRLELCPDLREIARSALVDEPPNHRQGRRRHPRGYNAELDELHEIASGGKDWIARSRPTKFAAPASPV